MIIETTNDINEFYSIDNYFFFKLGFTPYKAEQPL